ncbi:Uma2 family endonuclease [Leptolyngbya sp. DQ-M1]|uniref:Uma2 family endonuclease n=1 Tax=Leptolyngbya sp. DQ-M1 TaxID=2933920 RepID=UPI0032992B1F
MSLTAKDLEIVQAQLAQGERDYRIELINGEIILMSPSGYESDEVASEFNAQLRNWVKPRKLGRVTGAGAGFVLPNSDTRAPDVSFVQAERLRQSPETFAELAPDLMVEVKSPSDSVKKLRAKIDQFLEQGTRVGILIHPKQRWVEVRRSNIEPVTLKDGDVLTVPDLLPGWEVRISELWSPVFED